MAEIKITFDLTFSRRFITAAGTAAMMLCAVPELDSESVTLSTYYPAPSGVYTKMITTGATYLARDGGNVGLGTQAPDYKLDVRGAIAAGTSELYFTDDGHNFSTLNVNGLAAIENSLNYNTLMILGRGNGIQNVRSVSIWDRLDINGNLAVTGAATVTGNSRVDGNFGVGMDAVLKIGVVGDIGATGVFRTAQVTGCVDVTANYGTPAGGIQILCTGGKYITNVDGVYSTHTNLGGTTQANTSARCCPCPTGGCTL